MQKSRDKESSLTLHLQSATLGQVLDEHFSAVIDDSRRRRHQITGYLWTLKKRMGGFSAKSTS